jgi:hypothetical protein
MYDREQSEASTVFEGDETCAEQSLFDASGRKRPTRSRATEGSERSKDVNVPQIPLATVPSAVVDLSIRFETLVRDMRLASEEETADKAVIGVKVLEVLLGAFFGPDEASRIAFQAMVQKDLGTW